MRHTPRPRREHSRRWSLSVSPPHLRRPWRTRHHRCHPCRPPSSTPPCASMSLCTRSTWRRRWPRRRRRRHPSSVLPSCCCRQSRAPRGCSALPPPPRPPIARARAGRAPTPTAALTSCRPAAGLRTTCLRGNCSSPAPEETARPLPSPRVGGCSAPPPFGKRFRCRGVWPPRGSAALPPSTPPRRRSHHRSDHLGPQSCRRASSAALACSCTPRRRQRLRPSSTRGQRRPAPPARAPPPWPPPSPVSSAGMAPRRCRGRTSRCSPRPL
ncbi:hypothetical protein BU14_0072s0077 [Porphyra umbilicalis]|uniref:Uncharacterized protein n=1 Tax=Porphyra umbilicalis TaxID=2786 RepID=A0A1X6PFU2_PORUM|nr:hypothetical protein BU14_0072s0077 [Porphyra umbilicalis]|eukprot:OSX79719.1 hypothetical protein BU14_0072s0077 [Porphyra umbilicalis]